MVSGKAERHLHDRRARQPLSTQSTFEDLAVDFEGTTASGAERFYRRTLDQLRLKLLESGLVHTVTLKQTECRKKNKNSRRDLPVSGRQRRRVGRASV